MSESKFMQVLKAELAAHEADLARAISTVERCGAVKKKRYPFQETSVRWQSLD